MVRPNAVIESSGTGLVGWSGLLERQQPVILRGLARDWPLVVAGRRSPQEAMAYLKLFDLGPPVTCYSGDAGIGGKFFYDETLAAMNFVADRRTLGAVLDSIMAEADGAPGRSFYIGSTDVDLHLPGFRTANDLGLDEPMFAANPPVASIWIGNRTTAAAHYDFSNNIACCLVGRRRFTLFPPDQIANLYPGPLDPTPGGQAVSLVDFDAPDFDAFPRFRDALDAGQVAELEAGDVLFYPAMWWHQVEALAPFNAMMNYWWNTSPGFMDTPMNTLLHGILSLRDRPDAEKAAWRAVFDHYVFGSPEQTRAHIPQRARGGLSPLDDRMARRLRAHLLDRINR